MKRLITLILVVALALSVCACSPVNSDPVAVLWADGNTAVDPNSLINAMDRAMYIESISYTYYGAQGDAAKQLQQAEEALAAGCSVLVVEPIDPAAAEQFVELAKAKDVSVLFFNKAIDESVVASYAKCYAVYTEVDSLAKTYFELVSAYVLKNTEVEKAKDGDLDLDDDGKISYVTVGEITLAETTAMEKDTNGEPKLNKDGSYKKAVELVKLEAAFADLQLAEDTRESGGLFGGTTTYRQLKTADGKVVELILVEDDVQAKDVLMALLAKGMNADQLATCFVPVFTVGNTVDYKALVLEGAPTEADARKAHFESNKFLCDLTAVEEADLDEMIFTTLNVIDTGRITGTALEDYDGIAEAVAKAASAICKGKTTDQTTLIPYTTHENG